MTLTVDDLSLRTGSVPSLVLTIVGLYLRRTGDWLSTAQLVRLSQQVGAAEPLVRSAMTRLKKRGVLVAAERDGAAGYAFAPEAERLFQRGDRRIFNPRHMGAGDEWCVISFSLSEEFRATRHQLRKRLSLIGCGNITPGLWICPDFLSDEVEEILDELEIRQYATVFRTETPRTGQPFPQAIEHWWDLDALRGLHKDFLAVITPMLPFEDVRSDAEAFTKYVTAIDAWRDLPYLDPGIPFEFLPGDWPGRRSMSLFVEMSEAFAERAWRHVAAVTETPVS